ncbi:MAG: L,D-transpeptidase family protein [Chitinophagaceae bacterium]
MSKKDIFLLLLVSLCVFASCRSKKSSGKDMAASPEELNAKVTDLIRSIIDFAGTNEGKVDDSASLDFNAVVKMVYEKEKYASVWSENEKWKPLGDTLLRFIDNAKLYGLFPQDYHYDVLDSIRIKFFNDSLSESDRKNAALWSKADVLLTDAFVHIVKDIKLGRLPQDSITLRKDSVLTDEFYYQRLKLVQKNNAFGLVFHALEPKYTGYNQLKAAIPAFLSNVSNKVYTLVPAPSKKQANFKELLQKRLFEGGFIDYDSTQADSVEISAAVKKFQENNGITIDGKVGDETVRVMNISDRDKFIRIAITMDRYKLMPDQMPSRYVWVNLPGYYMNFYENDTLALTSKIICGKPKTRTPLLTSAISELITYPQWTPPPSIILKEILPAVKKNPGYLAKKGFSLLDKNGDEVDPYSVEWSQYSKGIPYRVVQGSGDDNALGILKFNFPNKYAVYLHDTNQRYLFSQTTRSLSHGCVRVQEWQKLAYSIVRYDHSTGKPSVEDSLSSWLKRKVKRSISVKNKLPVFIRYFSCEGKNGSVVFYDDIYGEDKGLQQKYFATKKI